MINVLPYVWFKKATTCLVLLVIIVYFPANVTAFSDYLVTSQKVSLIPHIQVYEDTTTKLNIDQILAPDFNNKFRPVKSKSINFGHSKSTFWFKLKPGELFDPLNSWMLLVDNYWLDQIDVYIFNTDDSIRHEQVGYRFPFHHRKVKINNFAFHMNKIQNINTVYLKIRDPYYQIEVPLFMITSDTLLEKQNNKRLLIGFFVGIMLMLAVNGLIMLFSTRDITYIYYSIWCICITLYVLNINGMSYQYLWSNQVWVEQHAYKVLSGLCSLSILLFVKYLLKTKEQLPKLNKLIGLFVVLAVLLIIKGLTNFWIVYSAAIFAICIAVLLTVVTIASIRLGNKIAKYFLISFGFLDVYIIFGLLNSMLFLNYIEEDIVAIGSMIQAVLISMAMLSKVAHLKKEKELAQEALTKKLGKLVEEKTEKLVAVNKKLSISRDLAEAANLAKNDFLANISHEIRNPMHHILSFSKFGLKKTDPEKDYNLNRYFTQINKSAGRLMYLLNDLLDLSKIESGRMRYEMVENDFQNALDEVLKELSTSFENKSLKLNLNIPVFIDLVQCDQLKIEQVIRNLLTNAIQYSPEGKQISIDIKIIENVSGNLLQTSIYDEGPGIPEDELDAVFQKFNQSSFTKTGAGGTGLGLAICHEIIQAHKGKIWAKNNPEQGATFTFQIPFSKFKNKYN